MCIKMSLISCHFVSVCACTLGVWCMQYSLLKISSALSGRIRAKANFKSICLFVSPSATFFHLLCLIFALPLFVFLDRNTPVVHRTHKCTVSTNGSFQFWSQFWRLCNSINCSLLFCLPSRFYFVAFHKRAHLKLNSIASVIRVLVNQIQ